MNYKYVLVLVVVVSGLSYYLGTKSAAVQQTVTDTKVVTKDKIVTVTKIVKEPNGKTETEITKTEDKQQQKEEKKQETKVVKLEPQWEVSGMYALNERLYSLSIQRRIVGPIKAGVQYIDNGVIMGVVSVEF